MTESKVCRNSVRFSWILLCLVKTTILTCSTKDWHFLFSNESGKLPLLQLNLPWIKAGKSTKGEAAFFFPQSGKVFLVMKLFFFL